MAWLFHIASKIEYILHMLGEVGRAKRMCVPNLTQSTWESSGLQRPDDPDLKTPEWRS